MKSKNGTPELVSLLQYMKETKIDNPEILVKDSRIVRLDEVVQEVKQSEEWEAVKMNLLEIGIEKGREEGRLLLTEAIRMCRSEKYTSVEELLAKGFDEETAKLAMLLK